MRPRGRCALPKQQGDYRGPRVATEHAFPFPSIGGLRGGSGASLYCSTKFVLEGLSESFALEPAPFGLKVTEVEPGFFRTDSWTGAQRFMPMLPSKTVRKHHMCGVL